MMPTEILRPDAVRSAADDVTSKKRALGALARMLHGSAQSPDCDPADEAADRGGADSNPPSVEAFFEAMNEREKLGSTGLGHGIAIPHGRMPGIHRPVLALLRLQQGLDFEAIDNEPVDLLIALIVPEDAPAEHLGLLAKLARGLSQPGTVAALRNAPDDASLHSAFDRHFSGSTDTHEQGH